MMEDFMIGRVGALIYGLGSYLVFFCANLYAMGFIGNYLVPRSIDIGVSASLAESIPVDLLLVGAFSAQHSVMARPAFKQWWTTIVPSHCERSTYVLLSSLLLLVIFWQWRPITMTVWQADQALATVLTSIYWTGWLIAFSSTFLIDHFDLFGLRQVFAAPRGTVTAAPVFKTPLLYRLVRHPIMLGFLLVFWATPQMSAGHLLFAVLTTGYVLVGVQLEENDLMAEFGDRYKQYRQRVPMLLPRILGR
jgi:methanethiol S-methyltransferase